MGCGPLRVTTTPVFNTVVTSEEELLRIFRESGNALEVKVDYDQFTKIKPANYFESVMQTVDFLSCADHLHMLTSEERNDHDKMFKLIKIFMHKHSKFMGFNQEFEDCLGNPRHSGWIDPDIIHKYAIEKHPLNYVSNKLLNNVEFVQYALSYMHQYTETLMLPVCKRVFAWWIQKKPWFLALLSKNYIDVEDKMVKHKMFSKAKPAAELVKVDVSILYMIKEHNSSMLSDVKFWKRIFQTKMNLHDTRICMDYLPNCLRQHSDISEKVSTFEENLARALHVSDKS